MFLETVLKLLCAFVVSILFAGSILSFLIDSICNNFYLSNSLNILHIVVSLYINPLSGRGGMECM